MALFKEIFCDCPDLLVIPGLSEISVAEGVISLLLASLMKRDTLMSEDAVEKVSSVISKMRLFQSYSQNEVEDAIARIRHFYERHDPVHIIRAAKQAVPPNLQESVFAIAAELVPIDTRADGSISLIYMAQELNIPKATRKCVLEARQIKRRAMIWDETTIAWGDRGKGSSVTST
ncbi:hypothetical protein SPB21_03795 [Leptothoe sp. ISB3NOV94-8A]